MSCAVLRAAVAIVLDVVICCVLLHKGYQVPVHVLGSRRTHHGVDSTWDSHNKPAQAQ